MRLLPLSATSSSPTAPSATPDGYCSDGLLVVYYCQLCARRAQLHHAVVAAVRNVQRAIAIHHHTERRTQRWTARRVHCQLLAAVATQLHDAVVARVRYPHAADDAAVSTPTPTHTHTHTHHQPGSAVTGCW